GYFPVPPVDRLQDLRSKIMLALIASGVDVEVHHHEVGTAGQTEIDMRFTTLGRMADQLMMYKYIVKNVCHQHGYTATFMPKPMFGDNGSAICRIPVYSKSPKAKRIEFRAPDPSSNPYLTFAALLMAGLDGIKHKIEPPKPMDVDLYDLEPEERKHVKNTPGSLNESLAAL